MDGATGEVLWSQHYAGHGDSNESVYAIALDASDNVFLTGRMTNGISGDDILIMKLAAGDGDILWNELRGGADGLDDRGWDIAVGLDGNPVITGMTANSDGSGNFFTSKLTSSLGGDLWTRELPGAVNNPFEPGGWLAICENNDVVMANRIWEPQTSTDLVLHRYAAGDGATVWAQRYDSGLGADDPYHMVRDGAGDLLVAGVTHSDFMALKFDREDGALLWAGGYDGPPGWYDKAKQVIVGPQGEVIVAGFSDGGATGWDITAAAFEPETGDFDWVLRYDPGEGYADEATALVLSPQGDLYIVGYVSLLATNSDIAALRYAPGTSSVVPSAGGERLRLSAGPNPACADLTIAYSQTLPGHVLLTIHDLTGRRLITLADARAGAETQVVRWDGTDHTGTRLGAGIYLLRLAGMGGRASQRIVLAR